MQFIYRYRATFDSIVRIVLLSRWSGILKSTIPKGKSCVIVGNGPSFTQSIEKYRDSLMHHDLMCVNSFSKSSYYEELKPIFYIISASVLFQPDEEQNEEYREMKKDIFSNLEKKTTWDMEIMVPFIAKKSMDFQQILIANKHLKAIYYNLTPVEGFKWFSSFLYKKGIGMPRPHNVMIPGIMNLIKLHYSQIILIGADHSWLSEITVSENNEALVSHKHFYTEGEVKPKVMEDRVKPRRLHEVLEKFQLTFKGYWDIVDFIEGKDISIFNCSETSMVDAFERKKITELQGNPEKI